jgi:hypothetical protein
VYFILSYSRYPFSLNTLFDNYRAIHLVNNKSLLDSGSFIKANSPEYIKAGTLSLPILSRSTRTFKRIINKAYNKAVKDLILKDIVIIKGFYMNIIFEARLLLSKV